MKTNPAQAAVENQTRQSEVTEPQGKHRNLNSLSGTFDQVEVARRRIAELVWESESIADRAAVASRIGRTASHCWCFWIAPQPRLPALLISGDWNLSAFVLLGLFSRVDVWETDAQRAAVLGRVAAEFDMDLNVQYCPPAQFADRLKTLSEPYGLAAMQDAFGLIPRRSRVTRRDILHGLAVMTKAEGQCCVVGRNRFALTEVSRLFRNKQALPTPAELRRGWSARNHDGAESIFFHPDHHDPGEVLFPSALLPQARRDRMSMRLLERAGVIERILGSFASFLPLHRGSLLIDLASSHWQNQSAAAGVAHWRDCSVKENAMMFVTVALADGGDAIVRIPLLREAVEALARLDKVYLDIARTLPALGALIPKSAPLFGVFGWPMHMERKCRGVPVRMLVRDPRSRTRIRAQISEFVNGICAATVERHAVNESFVEVHYRSKFRSICAVEPEFTNDCSLVESAAIALALGRAMPTVRIHGDLTVNNVFLDPATLALTGVIDWEASLTGSMPFDLIHYLIAECRELEPQPWGVLVASALAGDLFDAEAKELLLSHLKFLGLVETQLTPLLVAYWVRGVALRQALSGGRLTPAWRERNVIGPLDSIKRTLLAGN